MMPLRQEKPLSADQELGGLITDSMLGTRIAARGYMTAWVTLREAHPDLEGLQSYNDLLANAAQMINHFTWQVEILRHMVGKQFGIRPEFITQQERILDLLNERLALLSSQGDNIA